MSSATFNPDDQDPDEDAHEAAERRHEAAEIRLQAAEIRYERAASRDEVTRAMVAREAADRAAGRPKDLQLSVDIGAGILAGAMDLISFHSDQIDGLRDHVADLETRLACQGARLAAALQRGPRRRGRRS